MCTCWLQLHFSSKSNCRAAAALTAMPGRRGKEERSKITITWEDCAQLVKEHVEDPGELGSQEPWMHATTETIIVQYSMFLQALISKTNRCSVHILKHACKHAFDVSWDIADWWAQSVHNAFVQCVSTGRNMKDGTRLVAEVAATATAFKRKLSISPSPSCSPSAERTAEDRTSTAERLARAMWAPLKQECPSATKTEVLGPQNELIGPPAAGPPSSNVEDALSLWADLPSSMPLCNKEPRDEKPPAQVVRAVHACTLVNRGYVFACVLALH